MDPRLQAGLELQLDKQAQQEYDSSLSGVLGQHFKQAEESPAKVTHIDTPPNYHPGLLKLQEIVGALAHVDPDKGLRVFPRDPDFFGRRAEKNRIAKYVASPTTEADLYRTYGRVPRKMVRDQYPPGRAGYKQWQRHLFRYPLRDESTRSWKDLYKAFLP